MAEMDWLTGRIESDGTALTCIYLGGGDRI